MKRRWIVLSGLAAFVVAFLLGAPAATLYGWAAPRGAQVHGIDGTLSSGSATGVSLGGRPLLGPTTWRLDPLWLPLLKAAFRIDARGPLTGSGELRLSPFGSQSVRDLRATGELKPLLALFNYGFLPVDARGGLQLKRLDLIDGMPRLVDGRVQVQGLTLRLGRDPLQLGDFEALLSTDGTAQKAVLSSPGGPLDFAGEATLASDGAWEAHLQLKTRPDAPPELGNWLRTLGQPDPQGYFHLRRSGVWVRASAPVDAAGEGEDAAAEEEPLPDEEDAGQ